MGLFSILQNFQPNIAIFSETGQIIIDVNGQILNNWTIPKLTILCDLVRADVYIEHSSIVLTRANSQNINGNVRCDQF